MDQLVDGVLPDPLNRALGLYRPVVDDGTGQVLLTQPVEDFRQPFCRIENLLSHNHEVLFAVPEPLGAIITAHRVEGGRVLGQTACNAAELDQQDVADMTPVLERRPNVRRRPGTPTSCDEHISDPGGIGAERGA